MSKIIFTGDILRVGTNGAPNQWGNIGWMKKLLYPAVNVAIRKANFSEVSWIQNHSNFDGSMVYAAHGLHPSPYAWADLFHRYPNELALNYIRDYFDDSIIIGFELSPYLRRAFDLLNCSYIDICIHPVRYMEDLLVNIATNKFQISRKIKDYSYSDNDFKLRSTFLAGAWRAQGFVKPRQHTAALLCLQTSLDRVLISDGNFINVSQYIDDIIKIRDGVDRFYVKPHPVERNELSVGYIVDHIKDVEVINSNFYEMIARSDIDSVYSLSSGTTTEAHFLGLNSRHLYRDYYLSDENKAGGSKYYPIMDEVLWPDFWRHILKSVVSVTPKGGYNRSVGKQTLRKTLGQSWDFEKWS